MKLSVLITYFNEKELLTECLQSLYEQPQPPDEVLIYDDASAHPAEHYIKHFPVKVIRGESNRGPSFGRNQLLASATGDFIHFHDADDWFDNHWCGSVRKALVSGNLDAVFTEVSSYRFHRLVAHRVVGLENLKKGGDLVRFCIQNFMLVPCGTFRRALVEKIGGYRLGLWQSEDFDFHVRLAMQKISYAVLTKPLVNIQLRSESRSQNRLETCQCTVQALELLSQELPKEYQSDLAEKAAVIGSQLFKMGERADARKAFALAHRLGPLGYQSQKKTYRFIAKLLGPEAAEWTSLAYRRLLPEFLRRLRVS